jgi:hypothetical protein
MKDKNGVTLRKGDRIKVTVECFFAGVDNGSVANQYYGENSIRVGWSASAGYETNLRSADSEGTVVEKMFPPHPDGMYQSEIGSFYLKSGDRLRGILTGSFFPVSDIDDCRLVHLVPEKK